ncbi:MAG: hypothetical protein MI674_00420, partial [Cytophagales bacterium]|nr:hypothetical protein [Cytophagales bacterium]
MKPKPINILQENLLAPRISSLIEPKNTLVLADPIDWTAFEKCLKLQAKCGQKLACLRSAATSWPIFSTARKNFSHFS